MSWYLCYIYLVYFPTTTGSYVPIVFVPGFNGFIYSEWYSDTLSQLASHGYIVIGIDLGFPANDLKEKNYVNKNNAVITAEPERMFKAINWVNDQYIIYND